jgi:hypothetical protein
LARELPRIPVAWDKQVSALSDFMNLSRVLRAAVVVALMAVVAACEVNLNSEGVVARETKTFQLTGEPDVHLDTFDGAIEVHSWDRNEVEVEVERRAPEQSQLDAIRISSEQQGNRVVLKVTGPAREGFSGIQVGMTTRPSARLRVAVPRESNLTIATRNGSITVEDVAGKFSLTTSDGSVRGSRLNGDIVARSGDGSIRMDTIEGRIDVETDDGSIVLEARASSVRARTGDGSIRLRVSGDSVMAGDWDVHTGDGAVVVMLPMPFDAELDAETADGSVRSTHPAVGDASAEDRREDRRTLRATLGKGGYTLRIRTGDGSIRIEP